MSRPPLAQTDVVARIPGADPASDQTIESGISLHRAGRFREAEAIYTSILNIDPENPDALHLNGVIAHQTGRDTEAVELIRRAIALWEDTVPQRPANPVVYNNLGEAYRGHGERENAIACYRRALEIKPDYAEANYHLGLVFLEGGKDLDAIACFRDAIRLKPALVLAHYNLGCALKARGMAAEAVMCFQEVLRFDPANEFAKFALSSLTDKNPERAPISYVANLFDNHAAQFDQRLVDTLRYSVPQNLVSLARERSQGTEKKWNVLDLGCGTGLAGVAVAPFAQYMVGIDLSRKMLEKARERSLYQRLEHGDLLPMMIAQAPMRFDLIIAADVFIYLGNLANVIEQMPVLLHEDGCIAFSVEALEHVPDPSGGQAGVTGYLLLPSGRYAHSSTYLNDLAQANGFRDVSISPTEIRLEGGTPVRGWLVMLALAPK